MSRWRVKKIVGLFSGAKNTQGQKILIISGFSSRVIISQPEGNSSFMVSPSNAVYTFTVALQYNNTVIHSDKDAAVPEVGLPTAGSMCNVIRYSGI